MARASKKAGTKSGGKPAGKANGPKKTAAALAKPSVTAVALRKPSLTADVLDRLWTVVMDRRTADPAYSHSARLLGRGTSKVAQKFGEEAVECLIEAVAGNKTALVSESADVLYHLLLMWVSVGVEPADVWAELQRREGVSGITEKATRPSARAAGTTKIP